MELNKKPLLTLPQVAEILSISKAGMYRLVGQRQLPFYKVGRSLRFSEEDVQDYLSRNRVKAMVEWSH